MSTALRVERLQGLAALEGFAAEWSELCARAAPTPPCNEPAWVCAHARAFGRAESAFALVARDAAGRALGCLPLAREPARSWWALRRLRHAADGNFDSEMLEPLCAPGREAEVAAALCTALARERGAGALLLFCAPRDGAGARALEAELARRGWPLRREPLVYLCADFEPSFEASVAALKSRMRSKVRAALRSIDAQGARARFVESPAELEAGLGALFALHQSRWTASGRAGSFADARRTQFYREIAAHYLAQGRLRLALLERAGQPVAALFGLVTGSTFTQVQEGFDQREADWRPGTALRAWVLRAAIEAGVRRCDFQEGDAPHKRDWGARELGAHTLVIGLPRWRTRAEFWLRAHLER